MITETSGGQVLEVEVESMELLLSLNTKYMKLQLMDLFVLPSPCDVHENCVGVATEVRTKVVHHLETK